MASKSYIGIDFGNEECRYGFITGRTFRFGTLPSCVAFTEKDRIIGQDAKNQMFTNLSNTVFGFKRLLGRTFSDPYVQKELKHFPFKVEARPNDTVGIRVKYLGEDNVYSPEQLTAMLFTEIKKIVVDELQMPSHDCVISVPIYFTNAQRMALLDAVSIAELKVLRLLDETSAVALSYGHIYSWDLLYNLVEPKNVVFVDFGHSSLQVSACEFRSQRELRVLATATDAQCGGRDIDSALAEYFTQDFISRFKLDASKDQRAYLRLMQEVENIRQRMSCTSKGQTLEIELEGREVTSYLQSSDMERICQETFSRFEKTLKALLINAKLIPEDIYAVKVVGSCDLPVLKTLIRQVFGQTSSLIYDQEIARGCALQCAVLNRDSSVSELYCRDVQHYGVRLAWRATGAEPGQLEILPPFHAVPCVKRATFYRKEPFSVKLCYSDEVPYLDKLIGEWTIYVNPTDGESQRVDVEVSVNDNGIIDLKAPRFNVCKKQSEDLGSQEPRETKAASQDQNVPKDKESEKKQDSSQNESVEEEPSEDLGPQEPMETDEGQQNVPKDKEIKTEKTLIAENEIACMREQHKKEMEYKHEQHKKEMEYKHELHKIQMENEKLKTVILSLEIELLSNKLADVKKIREQ